MAKNGKGGRQFQPSPKRKKKVSLVFETPRVSDLYVRRPLFVVSPHHPHESRAPHSESPRYTLLQPRAKFHVQLQWRHLSHAISLGGSNISCDSLTWVNRSWIDLPRAQLARGSELPDSTPTRASGARVPRPLKSTRLFWVCRIAPCFQNNKRFSNSTKKKKQEVFYFFIHINFLQLFI